EAGREFEALRGAPRVSVRAREVVVARRLDRRVRPVDAARDVDQAGAVHVQLLQRAELGGEVPDPAAAAALRDVRGDTGHERRGDAGATDRGRRVGRRGDPRVVEHLTDARVRRHVGYLAARRTRRVARDRLPARTREVVRLPATAGLLTAGRARAAGEPFA